MNGVSLNTLLIQSHFSFQVHILKSDDNYPRLSKNTTKIYDCKWFTYIDSVKTQKVVKIIALY